MANTKAMQRKNAQSAPKSMVIRYTPLEEMLSKVDCQLFAFILLFILCFQPLVGAFKTITDADGLDALFLSKASYVRVIGILGVFVFAIDYIKKSCILGHKPFAKRTFLKNPWTMLFLGTLFWAFLSACCAKYSSERAWSGGAYRYEGFVSYFAYAGIFMLAMILRNSKLKNIIYRTFASVAFLLNFLVIGKYNFSWDLMERNGLVMDYSATFVNPNHYGYYIAIGSILALLLFIKGKIWEKPIYAIFFATGIYVLLHNMTLGAFLALVLGIILVLVLSIIRKDIDILYLVVPILIFALIFACVPAFRNFLVEKGFDYTSMVDDVKEALADFGRIADAFKNHSTVEELEEIDAGTGRWKLWVGAVRCMLDYPIFGVGPDNIEKTEGYMVGVKNPHSEYLQFGCNCGLIGFLLYMGALFTLLFFCFKKTKKMSKESFIALGTAFTYACSALVGVSMTISDCNFFMFLGFTASFFFEENTDVLMEDLSERDKKVARWLFCFEKKEVNKGNVVNTNKLAHRK